jgi:hypothetical protein
MRPSETIKLVILVLIVGERQPRQRVVTALPLGRALGERVGEEDALALRYFFVTRLVFLFFRFNFPEPGQGFGDCKRPILPVESV